MRGAERELAHGERALHQVRRLACLRAGRARLGQALEGARGRDVVGREGALADLEHAAPEQLRRVVAAERLPHVGEAGEDGGDLGVILALGALDGVEALEDGLRQLVRAAPQVEARERVEEDDEVGVLGAQPALAEGDCAL